MISEETKAYYDLKKRNDVRESAKRIRRRFLRYKDAEIVYSLQHKKILELASEAGAIYRMNGTVLINRDIFEEYLERFHEPSTLLPKEEQKRVETFGCSRICLTTRISRCKSTILLPYIKVPIIMVLA